MTMKHVIDGLMQATHCPSHHALSLRVGIDKAAISRMCSGKCNGIGIEKLDQIQTLTGVSPDDIFAWFRMPDGTVLGRIPGVRE